MLLLLWGVVVIGATWILAWHLGTQAAIAGAIVITVAVLGVLIIFWALNRSKNKPWRN